MRRAEHKGEGAGFMCEGALYCHASGVLYVWVGGSLQKEAGLK